jgi:hypothetical protein
MSLITIAFYALGYLLFSRLIVPVLPKPVPFYINGLSALVLILLSVSYGSVLILLLAPFGQSDIALALAGRLYAFLIRSFLGISTKITSGAEWLNTPNAVFIANHQT